MLTHNELVKIAARWLRTRQRCYVVLTEMSTRGEIPDAIGWKYGHRSMLVECKVSRSDFFTDRDKLWRKRPELGMGERRYYLVPEGLITVEEIPFGWGLLEVYHPGSTGYRACVREIQPPALIDPRGPAALHSEMVMLTSALRRVQIRLGQVHLNEYIAYDTKPTRRSIRAADVHREKPQQLPSVPVVSGRVQERRLQSFMRSPAGQGAAADYTVRRKWTGPYRRRRKDEQQL